MQRRAQRDDHFGERATRTVGGVNRVLAVALAVPVMLFAAACSSDDDSGSGDDTAAAGSTSLAQDDENGGSGTDSATPTVEPAAYATLPGACKVLSKKTLSDLVPKGTTSGKEGGSSDVAARTSCSWSSLKNNGVKGSQFRWLNISFLRFDSDATAGDAETQAETYYAKQVESAQSVKNAKNTKTETFTGTGDEATAVRYDLKKKEGAFKQQTIVTRVENVVVTLDYNGAGLAGDKTPDADTLMTAAKKAAKETVTAVRTANGEETNGSSTASPTPSASRSASKSTTSTSKATSRSAAKSTSRTTKSATKR